jgi:hypothetical protein
MSDKSFSKLISLFVDVVVVGMQQTQILRFVISWFGFEFRFEFDLDLGLGLLSKIWIGFGFVVQDLDWI